MWDFPSSEDIKKADLPDYNMEMIYQKQIAMLESLLCSTCRVLEKTKYDFDENPRLIEWWDKHKKQDLAKTQKEQKLRLRKEQAFTIAQKPFSSLTTKEKKILKEEGYF